MFLKNRLKGADSSDGIVPPGCNPLKGNVGTPVVRVVSGDTWTVDADIVSADGGPASPGNSNVEFVLAENQFSPPIWTGVWVNGVLPDPNRPGLAHVRIPIDITKSLRRGSYMFSMRVSDRMRSSYSTQLAGYFLVEYMPTSDHRSIPYRDGTSEIFSDPSGGDNGGNGAETTAYAPLDSPAFTGMPTAPDPGSSPTTRSQIATTKYISNTVGQKLCVWLSVDNTTGVVSANYDDGN